METKEKSKRKPVQEEETDYFMGFEEAIEKQNAILKVLGGSVLLCFAVISVIFVASNKINILKHNEFFSQDGAKIEVCGYAVKGILKGNLHKGIFTEEARRKAVMERLQPHTEEIKKIFKPFMVESNKCKVVVKDAIGLLSYTFPIENVNGPYVFKATDYEEIEKIQTHNY
ncbi:MAG: hypothetical protein CME70_03225 [Halobacteriovorax sp.]|nr:hypothetical protein [Halobacteriovorax sp.]MBK22995.1 hypothetical protein [Halobacteriovorax sp.]|tara:strand:- start:2231 stop:2743 length:513 start_codon:yes stop_codon:yes gene_type:complete